MNTPSMQRPSEMVYSELDPVASIRPSQAPVNDSDLDLVPLLHYPSVERILSSSNGRKSVEPIARMPPRMPDLFPKLEAAKPPAMRPAPPAPPEIGTERVRVPISQPPPPPPPSPDPPAVDRAPDPVIDSATKVDQIVSNRSPEPPPAQPVPEQNEKPTADTDATYKTKSIGNISGLAWDIHVYLAATLFSILALHAFWNLIRINALKRLLPASYYVILHLLLLSIGILRSAYLFFDAYNAGKSLPASVNNLLLNVVGPLITSAFIVLFLFLLDASKVDLLTARSIRPALAAAFIVVHLVLCICLDLVSGWFPDRPHLRLVCQWIYIGVCAVLGACYLYVYKLFSRKVKSSFPGSECHSLAVSMRATLAVALLSILMAASQLYGVLRVNGSSGSEAWIWWGYEFSIRVIELSISFLLLWAGMQHVRGSIDDEKESHNSGFALFRCGQCRGSSTPPGGDNSDDIYPAVCVTNQAIHDYTLRTGKKVYDDSFPLNSLHHGSYASAGDCVNPMSTGDRRSLRKAAHDGGHSSNSMDRRQKQIDSVPEIRHSTQLISLGPAGSSAVEHLMGEGLSKTADRRSLRKQAECYTDGCRSLRHPPPRASPSSMLVAENGFVRFRTLAEPHAEIGPEDPLER